MDSGANSYRRFREGGDKQGLAEIIREYNDGLIFYLASIVGDIHTAEDIAADTYVLLGAKKPKDKGNGSFKTWLYTIARNLAIDHIRRQKRRGEAPLDEAYRLSEDDCGLEEKYIKEEQKIQIHRAMNRLKAEYRQVLWLVYFEEMSVKEAAGIMKKSVHSAEMFAHRARKALRAQLEKEGFDNEGL